MSATPVVRGTRAEVGDRKVELSSEVRHRQELFITRPSNVPPPRRTVCGMRENAPDPYLAQTGFDVDAEGEEFDAPEDFELDLDEGDDELEIEEERAREH